VPCPFFREQILRFTQDDKYSRASAAAFKSRSRLSSRRQESPSEGEEEPANSTARDSRALLTTMSSCSTWLTPSPLISSAQHGPLGGELGASRPRPRVRRSFPAGLEYARTICRMSSGRPVQRRVRLADHLRPNLLMGCQESRRAREASMPDCRGKPPLSRPRQRLRFSRQQRL
jgi:hypothetical protein